MTVASRRLTLPVTMLGLVVGGVAVSPTIASPAQPQCAGVDADIVGTPGNDPNLDGTDGPDVIVGLGGDDDIEGLGGNDLICAGDGADVIDGGNDVDTIFGEGGDGDTLEGGLGDDSLDGGPGTDGVSYANAAPSGVEVDLAAGNASGSDGSDTLANVEAVTGSNQGDTLLGDQTNNGFIGLGGNDTIDGRGAGDIDSVNYGLTGGVVANLTGGTAFTLGEGSDTLAGIENLLGSDGDDVLTGDGEFNGLFGEGGDDELFGRGDSDLLQGRDGDDQIVGGPGSLDLADFSTAPSAIDASLVLGEAMEGSFVDQLSGVEGLIGSSASDRLVGDASENFFIGAGGDDDIDGREAIDTVSYDQRSNPDGTITTDTGPVRASLASGTGVDASDPNQADGDVFTSIEELWGTPADDRLFGDRRRNGFLGLAGDDRIRGRRGDDVVLDDVGSDRIRGGRGSADLIAYFVGPPIRGNLTKGRISVGGGAGASGVNDIDRVKGLEFVDGSAGDDVIRGGPRRDVLLGEAGADRLFGRGGSDVLRGDEGADRLRGGPGRDHCLDRPRRGCEAGAIPRALRDRFRRVLQILRDIRRKRGLRRSF